MKRYIVQHKMITRPALIVLAALVVLTMAATPAAASQPVIKQVLGVDFGAKLNGRTNISTRIGGDPDRVVYLLSGPLKRVAVRTEAPYYFLRNRSNGRPKYWNTANAPEGAYTMDIRVIKDGRIADSVVIHFTIDRSAQAQHTLPRRQRMRTQMLHKNKQANKTATPNTGQSTGNNAGSSNKPVVSFAKNSDDTYERGSGENLDVTVSGQVPDKGDILAIAWDHTRKQIVDAFAHPVNKNNPLISSEKLDLLPEGRMQIQLLYREDAVIQYKKLHDLRVVTPDGWVDLGDEEPVGSNPSKIKSIKGVESRAALSGKVLIKVVTEGETPDEVIFNVTGPDELTYIKTQQPYNLFNFTGGWDTREHPNGQYSLTVSTLNDGDQTDSRTINFSINNVVTQPEPVVAFPSNTPTEYRLGEGIDVTYSVDKALPDNAKVLVLAWSAADWGMVNNFAHYADEGPWRISAEKMSLLKPGRAQLQLLYQVDNKTVYKRTHEVQILPAYGSQPDDNNTGNDGSNDSGDVPPPPQDNTDGGNTGSGSGDGSGGGSSGGDTPDDNSSDDNDDSDDVPSDTPPPDSVVNGDQSHLLGMNLSFVTYWTREWVFTNVLRQSQGWTSTNTGGQPYNAGREVPTDANGWPLLQPGHAASTIMLNGHDGRYPGGKYICTYDGEGDIVFGWDARNGASQAGRIEVHVNPTNGGIYMRIENSNLENPVRNVKLIHEDLVDHPSSFHPLFVERLKPFKTIRFMDWQRTNTTHQRVWSDRVTANSHTQGERGGVSIELMVELCNELGADPWFCMPAEADDDYINRFAQMVKSRLHKDAKVYVEWSNEVWNPQFEVHKRIKSETDNSSFSDMFFDKWATEAKRDFDIWTAVWGSDSHRIVRVAAGQAANVWVTDNLVKRLDGKLDAVSCASYFGITYEVENTLTGSTTVDDIIDLMESNILNENRSYFRKHGELARSASQKYGRHIKLIAYEGGQHLQDGGANKPHKDAMIAAQDHPKLYDLYLLNMLEFERAGGSANVQFNYVGRRDQWGSWGHLRYQDEPISSAQKFRAVLDYPTSKKRLELTNFD